MIKYLKDIPYRYIQIGIDRLKRKHFSVEWPEDDPSVTIGIPPDELEDHLRNKEWFEGVNLSYYYEGQDLDLRSPDGQDDGWQMEVHLRARATENGCEVIGHRERSRYEHQKSHINEVDYETLDKKQIQAYLP